MYYSMAGFFLGIFLLFLMFVFIAFGHRVGKITKAHYGLDITEGAVFTLMSLLVAFTFASASQRFDHRRVLIIDEANAISTSYLRLDILKPEDHAVLKKDFLVYVSSRLAIYEAVPDFKKVDIELSKNKDIQIKLWGDAVKACQRAGIVTAPMLILPTINSMFDIANTRLSYTYMHPSMIIFGLLLLVVLLGSFLTGYGIAGKGTWHTLHVFAFAFITAITIYVIIDLEYPRFGIIRESQFDSLLVDIKKNIQGQG